MRFFIALEIPDKNRTELIKTQQKIKQIIPEIRLTDPDKLHITIAFVGEQDKGLADDLIKIITASTDGVSPFTLTPGAMGGFPSLHDPSVLWMGVNGELDKLLIIEERIRDGLSSLNLSVDSRRYIPHIALGKTTNIKLGRSQEDEVLKVALDEFSPIEISSIKLFESVPTGTLHVHNTLAEIKLIQ